MSSPHSLALGALAKAVDLAFREAPHAPASLILARLIAFTLDHAQDAHTISAPAQFKALQDAAFAVIQDRATSPVAAYVTGRHVADSLAETLLDALPETDRPQAMRSANAFGRACGLDPVGKQQSRATDTAAARQQESAPNVHPFTRQSRPTFAERGPTPGDAA